MIYFAIAVDIRQCLGGVASSVPRRRLIRSPLAHAAGCKGHYRVSFSIDADLPDVGVESGARKGDRGHARKRRSLRRV